MRILGVLAFAGLAACAAPPPDLAGRGLPPDIALPPMKSFAPAAAPAPRRSNASIAADFMDLTFRLESGRTLEVFTRFERPITVAVRGSAPRTLHRDLDALLARFRAEAGIDIARAPAGRDAGITVEVITRRELQRAVPQAACFVVPRVSSWAEFRRNRRSPALDWTTLTVRERMAVFIPGDVSPQEVRDCLHEELAQAIGPLNDLYRLTDSVFNDDNFHTVLTGFDMLVLRTIYAPELRSGMRRDEVAARLPGILARLNPRGQAMGTIPRRATSRAWIDAIETALGPRTTPTRRRSAAREAVAIAREAGWNDNRTAFSLYALGRLSISTDADLALASFLGAARLYGASRETEVQAAHVGMQLAAFALSAGQADAALDITARYIPVVEEAQNAALLASLLSVRAEALALVGRLQEAETTRLESLGWARYGFGSDDAVRARAAEISGLSPRPFSGTPS